jgi:hypothetical protein
VSTLALLVFFVGLVLTAHAATPVSIDQLEQFLSANHTQSDSALAKKLGTLELTERASTTRLLRWRGQFSGKHTQEALTALVDSSAFPDLPPSDIRSTPKPLHDEMQQIMLRAIDYSQTTIHKLPDFTAHRATTYFDNLTDVRHELRAYFDEQKAKRQGQSSAGGEGIPGFSPSSLRPKDLTPTLDAAPLKISRETSTLVTYRDGHEVLDTQTTVDPQV